MRRTVQADQPLVLGHGPSVDPGPRPCPPRIVEAIGVVAFLTLVWWLARRAIFRRPTHPPGAFISLRGGPVRPL
jgi:hypothetical protein